MPTPPASAIWWSPWATARRTPGRTWPSGLAMTAMFPLWFIGGAVACAGLFYRNKLRRPLALLTQAAQRIAREDLDFSIAYDRRDEMGALCGAFEAMRLSLSQNNARMWRAMEERKKVNGAFAHDIRTPLTVIKGYAQLLDKQLAAQAAPEVTRPMVATIARQLAGWRILPRP